LREKAPPRVEEFMSGSAAPTNKISFFIEPNGSSPAGETHPGFPERGSEK
jgi:hypothetical protein